MGIDLTVAVLSLSSRLDTFLPNILTRLNEQAAGKPVEILCFLDNRARTVGEKRQTLLDMAKGQYITCVDDDDDVADDYIDTLLESIRQNRGVDVIAFDLERRLDDLPEPFVLQYHTDNPSQYTVYDKKCYPSHFCCHRTDNARQVRFEPINLEEDTRWAREMAKHIKSQARIDKTLYIYTFNSQTTETQREIVAQRARPPAPATPVVDVIILSHCLNHDLWSLTQNYAVNSCYTSHLDKSVNCNIIVLESNREQRPYDNCQTIYPDGPFSYSRYVNPVVKQTYSEFVCIAHNDAHFHPGWAARIIKFLRENPDVYTASAFCMYTHPHLAITQDSGTHEGMKYFTPWCFFHRRSLYDLIGAWDEQFIWWHATKDMQYRLRERGLKHVLVTNGVVNHIDQGGKTHLAKPLDSRILREQEDRFIRKWNSQLPC